MIERRDLEQKNVWYPLLLNRRTAMGICSLRVDGFLTHRDFSVVSCFCAKYARRRCRPLKCTLHTFDYLFGFCRYIVASTIVRLTRHLCETNVQKGVEHRTKTREKQVVLNPLIKLIISTVLRSQIRVFVGRFNRYCVKLKCVCFLKNS